MLSPLPRHRDWSTALLISPSPISLPRTGGQVGLCNVLFEDCSAFTRVTACTLAKSLNDPLHQRLQPLRYLHDCSDCFRLEQHRRVGFTPTEKRRLCTAHARKRPSHISAVLPLCSTSFHSRQAISSSRITIALTSNRNLRQNVWLLSEDFDAIEHSISEIFPV